MKRHSGGYHGRALFGGPHEVRFAFDSGRAFGICRKVYERRCTTRRVSERHRTAAMDRIRTTILAMTLSGSACVNVIPINWANGSGRELMFSSRFMDFPLR